MSGVGQAVFMNQRSFGIVNPILIPTDGLILYLDAGNPASYPGTGTIWTDLSGKSNTGTLTNGSVFGTDGGGSIVFDGANDKVVVPQFTSLNPPKVTVSCWVKRTAITPYTHFCGLPAVNGWANPYACYGLEFPGSGTAPSLLLGFTPAIYRYIDAPASPATALGVWSYIVGSYDGAFAKIYVNGVLITSVTETRTLITSTTDFVLGAESQATNAYPLNGKIGQAAVYDRALTDAEVLSSFNSYKSRYGL